MRHEAGVRPAVGYHVRVKKGGGYHVRVIKGGGYHVRVVKGVLNLIGCHGTWLLCYLGVWGNMGNRDGQINA